MSVYCSKRFRNLEKRVKQLENNFIKIKANGNYTKREEDCHRAYRVLAHAEIESYLEERTTEITRFAKRKWNNDKSTRVIAAINSYITNEESVANKEDGIKKDLHKRVNEAVNLHERRIRNNHGIKEVNVYKLLLPLGVKESDISQTLLNTLNTFGSNRGLTAHNSITHTQNVINPQDEVNTVNNIVGELEVLDRFLNTLKYK